MTSSTLNFDLMSSVLDGEATPEEQQGYEQCLESDAEARRAHQFQARFKELIRESAQTGPVPTDVRERLMKALTEAGRSNVVPLQPKLEERKPRRQWVAAASPWVGVAAAIGIIFGVSLVHQNSAAPESPLALAMARDHSQYVEQPVADHPGQVNPTLVAMHQFGSAPEIAEFPGLRPYDAQVCNCSLQAGHGPQQLLHVVYRTPDGNRVVSMYGVPAEQATGMPLNETIDRIQPTISQADLETLASWKRHGWVFSLVSNMPREQLQDLAQRGHYNGNAAYGSSLAQPLSPMQPVDQVNGAPVYPAVYQGR